MMVKGGCADLDLRVAEVQNLDPTWG